MTDIIASALSACALIVVAWIETRAAKERKRNEKREERRRRESRLSMELMYATAGLSMVTAKAMRDGHTNGELEGALKAAEAARNGYDSFLRDEASKAVAKP